MSCILLASRQLIVCLALLFVPTQLAWAASEVAKAPVETWVTDVDIPDADEARASQVRNGISYLLSDWQGKYRPGGYIGYEREAYKVVDRPGLEQAATINLKFDPARHTIKLNHLRVIRDGVVQDRLGDVTFDVYRQEKDSERGIFDGWLTARIDINDVRVGDVIDYATTTDRQELVGQELFYYRFSTQWDEPVGLIRREIIWPSSRTLTIKDERTSVRPKITPAGDQTRYLWEMSKPEPVKIEDNLPASFAPWGTVQISSTASWRDVADAVVQDYRPVRTFPPAFLAKLDSIAARHEDPRERMVEALRIVQDEVRYISLSMGAGSYLPRDPSTVIASGFGDCKDKTLLLVSALSYLGVKAEAALTDIDEGYGLNRFLPSLRVFDHAIVRAEIGARVYWLDGTDYLQGGRGDELVEPDFGYALPLESTNGALENMPAPKLLQPTVTVAEEVSFPAKAGDPLTLKTLTTYSGVDADAMRRKLAGRSIHELGDSYLQYYTRQYPGIRSTALLKSADDRDRNVVTLSETYELSADALANSDLVKNFQLRADFDPAEFPKPAAADRVGPIWIGGPMFRRHSVTVKNLKAAFSAEQAKTVVTPNVVLRTSWSSTPTEFVLSWDIKKQEPEVSAEGVRTYLAAVNDIVDNTQWAYDFSVEGPAEDEPMSGLEVVESMIFASWLLAVLAACIVEQRSFKPRPGQLYWPISPLKFMVMTAVTAGLYVVLWGWRVFRQQNLAYGARYWSFVRGLFLPIFMVQTFVRLNRDLGVRQVAIWLGVAAGLLFLGSELYSILFDRPEDVWLASLRRSVELVVAMIAPLPLVVVINRLNARHPEYLAWSSQFTSWDKVWIVAGVFYLPFIFYFGAT